ncbi:signal peptidase I [Caproicibacterium amylolyticum]|jgi:signal peptidase I|uniref:Signal peptidase I n=1 Tax=Caproicibacterium amylolyticum TaxID=2766537 RepID=A0A7G9WEQ8_9FIRM|nr:signal peptidase I [Caproicibacterium amylolyticum]MBE6722403.1 signal peptidase I [Oscillospiraceae bacterium]QNO17170.1 signal peptidase I [Caproicibacterium amylolyticum]
MEPEIKETSAAPNADAALETTVPEAQQPAAEKQEKKKDGPLSWILTMVITFAAALLFCAFVAQPRYVIGFSMQNTFQNNDFVFIWKLGYQPQFGDVVIANNIAIAADKREDLIKRVIGVSGDHIVVSNGTVTRNGKKLTEAYIKEQQWDGTNVDLTVPQGQVFLMGDNRNNSTDSRVVGPISCSSIAGKVVLRVYPFDKFGTF